MSVSSSGENVAVVAAAAELRQMSSCQNPAYGRLANFDIDRKVSFAYNQWKDSDQMTHFVQGDHTLSRGVTYFLTPHFDQAISGVPFFENSMVLAVFAGIICLLFFLWIIYGHLWIGTQ